MNGETCPAEAERHPDPITEAIRWQICEGQLLQIIGRARGVNRTAANPVDVYVMTNAPLPFPITRAIAADDLAPSPVDLMLAARGIAYMNAAHASRAYPGLWATQRAAERSLRTWKTYANPNSESLTGDSTGDSVCLPHTKQNIGKF